MSSNGGMPNGGGPLSPRSRVSTSPLRTGRSGFGSDSMGFSGEENANPQHSFVGGNPFAGGGGAGGPGGGGNGWPAEDPSVAKKSGARGGIQIGSSGHTQNQNNSILGRRSTRVHAPPGGASSFSLGGDF
mmetsp:Transcript_61747/g.139777  ORF Transcript_61747/g.139777 Transcript_61747/m.139777 type:complete len:130 (+) Transcript_61747:822-1211(+)